MAAMTCALVDRLQTIADPRRQCANLKPPLVDIILVGFCGVLGGCEEFVEIAEWAQIHEAAVRTFLDLPHGIPAHDTFTRVFAMLKPSTLQEVWLPWLVERRGLPGEWIHLEGKTLRQTGRTSPKLKALHVVSAWAGQTGLTLGQVAVAAKSNEITALPELLKLLDLHEKIVTTEAMGCQKDIAQTIVAGGGTTSWRAKTITRLYPPRSKLRLPPRPRLRPGPRASLPPKTRATGARNSARCRCFPRAGMCRARNWRCGGEYSPSSWLRASCGARRRGKRVSR